MLESDRLRLRPIEPGDLDAIHRWKNDTNVVERLLTRVGAPSRTEVNAWYEQIQSDENDQRFMIDATDGGRTIGFVGLYGIDEANRSAELGVLIGEREAWGQGFAPEAVERLAQYAFRELNLHRLSLRVRADHTRAIRAYEKSGFVEEGRLRDAWFDRGTYRDVVIMGRLRDD